MYHLLIGDRNISVAADVLNRAIKRDLESQEDFIAAHRTMTGRNRRDQISTEFELTVSRRLGARYGPNGGKGRENTG